MWFTLFKMISGATYSGVPQNVQVLPLPPILLAKPKSTLDEIISSIRTPEIITDYYQNLQSLLSYILSHQKLT